MTAQYLGRKYGSGVHVEYVDFANSETSRQYAGILEQMTAKDMWFPVVTVDDRIISYGYIDHTTIINILEEKAHKKV
jgi:disulfide oxidoreductase YuzD